MFLAVSASAESSKGFDCPQLADKPAPSTATEWLKRSMLAGHCYIFQARAVRISREGVRTLALSHDVRNGVVREVASYLDGPPVVYERHGKIVGSGNSSRKGINPTAPLLDAERVGQFYRLTLGGEERIAGRRSIRLDIEPLDSLRYGHRLWLDIQTGLPLKQVLLDIDGRILETFQMTELVDPTLYDQSVSFETLGSRPEGPWQPGWLPSGYQLSPLPDSGEAPGSALSHRLFSDGLSSFSLFIEPLSGNSPALRPGLHRLGISYAAVRHLPFNGRLMQIVVMGELPPQVLVRVAAELQFQPDSSDIEPES
ncbi:MucB/RseB C-terminal domain-containing protein [Modicisalibacter luteus]|uniref:MucB/RseB C-terminal domain-containing protein n=1 Tax=Modicisalibacter luteus TaxID=453962 RepID=A0ABV7M6A5_9GAMM|nr:MucB/RseB C-terminal domain-containing protein [Halomonas lutea]